MSITVTNSIEIDRPPAQVWAVVSDYAADTIWRKGIVEMTPDAEGPPQVGTHVREVLVLGGRRYTTETAVTDVGPGLTYGFAGTGTSGEVRGRRTVIGAGTPQSARFSYDVELNPIGPRTSSRRSWRAGWVAACDAICAACAAGRRAGSFVPEVATF